MAEYIDKAVALSIHEPTKSNRHYQTDNLDDAYEQGWDDALCSIEHIPAADVALVVHGRWIESKEHFYLQNGCKEWTNFYCSECDAPNNSPTNYCPNCGAKMDGGDQCQKY